jgi:type IV pilus assembly protein PilM
LRLAVSSVQKGKIVLHHLDHEPLPPGSLDINPFKPNIQSLEDVAEALKNLWSRNKYKTSRICLLLQDRAALTFHLTFEHPAKDSHECLDLIRFKLRKSVPFKIEESQITYFGAAGQHDSSATPLWVIIINHQVLHQYEKFIQSTINAECGLVDLSTLNFLNLAHSDVRASGLKDQDLLFVNLNQDYITIAITQKSNLMFFRSRALEMNNGSLKTALEEIHPTTLYYTDKLGGNALARAYVHAVDHNADELSAEIEKQFGVRSTILSIEPYTGARFDLSVPGALRNFAPLAGLLVSRKVEFQ